MMPGARLLLTNAAIVDAALPEPRPGMQILVEGDTIRDVFRSADPGAGCRDDRPRGPDAAARL